MATASLVLAQLLALSFQVRGGRLTVTPSVAVPRPLQKPPLTSIHASSQVHGVHAHHVQLAGEPLPNAAAERGQHADGHRFAKVPGPLSRFADGRLAAMWPSRASGSNVALSASAGAAQYIGDSLERVRGAKSSPIFSQAFLLGALSLAAVIVAVSKSRLRTTSCASNWTWHDEQKFAVAASASEDVPLADFVLGSGIDSSEVEALALRLASASSDTLWNMTEWEPAYDTLGKELPKDARWMNTKQFQAAAKSLDPNTSDLASKVIFMVLAGGYTAYVDKGNVDARFKSWISSTGNELNSGAFQLSALGAKANLLFAFWFLNVFAPFCTYFFFLRGPLKAFTGIDLLPGVPNFWERGG